MPEEIKIDSTVNPVMDKFYTPLRLVVRLEGNTVYAYYSDKGGRVRPMVVDPQYAPAAPPASSDNFVFHQSVPSAHWQIPYNPAWGVPNVDVYDSTNRRVYPYVEIETPGVVGIISTGGFSGYAKLNF